MTRAANIVRTLLIIALCMAFMIVSGCKRASQIFPATGEVTSWAKTGETRAFGAGELWKYIDGEAERYLKAGVQRVSTSDYKYQNKSDAVVDIYFMENTAGAGKIMASEPIAGAKPVPLGEEARLYNQSLVFRKGRYLVRIVAYEESGEVQTAILALGQAIAQRLGT